MRLGLLTLSMLTLATALAACGSQHGVRAAAAPARAEVAMEATRVEMAKVEKGDKALFREADADGDGRLVPSELPDTPIAGFRSLDGNSDGYLTFDEAMSQTLPTKVRAFFNRMAEKALKDRPDPGPEQPLSRYRGNPVVFVPGWLDAGWWYPHVRMRLEAMGRRSNYVHLFPNLADISLAAQVVKRKVEAVRAETGAAQVDLIGHSMGGLITRYYMKNLQGHTNVEHYVSLATPHHGTYMAYLHPPAAGVAQMRPGSDFLGFLNAIDETHGAVKYVSIRSGLDQIVIPHDSSILKGAANYEIRFAEHNSIHFSDETWQIIAREWGELVPPEPPKAAELNAR